MPIAAAEAGVVAADAPPGNSSTKRRWSLSSLRTSTERPEWPLVMLFVGYPLWWFLGVTQMAMFACCGVMGFRLLRFKRLVAPRGTRLWLAFLAWAVLGILVLQVDAPGTVVGPSSTRYLTWGLRLVWFLEATVFLLYVANVRRTMGHQRTARIFAAFFVTITIGGFIGSLAPATTVHSLVDLMAPRLSSNAFVSSLVHPVLAERQAHLGEVQYRPSAPFPYANRWGLNYACFLPIFIYSWCGKAAGWRRIAAPIVLLASVVPVVYSMNRGLWAALLAMLVIAVLKQVRAGRIRITAMLAVGALLMGAVIALSPLGAELAARFTGHNSNEGRTTLSLTSIASVADGSPVIGFGTTRKVQGSFFSIAGGTTADCPNCSPPSFGTQGSLWSLTFQQGLGGGAIGLAFFVAAAFRHRGRREPAAIAYLCTLTAFLATAAIYDWSETASFAVMTAIASLGAIATDSRTVPTRRSSSESLQPMPGLASPRVLIVSCLLGATLGATWQAYRGPTYLATTSVYLPAVPENSGLEPGAESTLDTQARIIAALRPSDPARATESSWYRPADAVTISAEPNTRIIDITYKSSSSRRAVSGARNLADAAIRERTSRLESERASSILKTRQQAQEVSSAAITADTVDRADGRSDAFRGTTSGRSRIDNDRRKLQMRMDELATVSTVGGYIVHPVGLRVAPEQWNLAIGSGAAFGILFAILLTDYRSARGVRLRKLSDTDMHRVLGGLATYCLRTDEDLRALRPKFLTHLGTRQALCLGPHADEMCSLVAQVGHPAAVTGPHPARDTQNRNVGSEVVGIVPSRTRVGQLMQEIARLRVRGIHVVGLVILHR